MTALVGVKQLIKSLYIRYEMWITPLWKFLLCLIVLTQINSHVGYLSAIKPFPVALMCALLCSFMPVNFMVFVASFFVLGHLYAVSIETLGVSLVLFLLMFLLYFRFGPGDTVVLLLMPILFLMRIPYLMPLALGLLGTPVSVAAMSCGTVVYYLLTYVQANATTMSASSVVSGEETEIVVQLRTFLTGFLMNRAMWVMVVALAAVLIVVYLLRRLPVDHAWKIAILGGAVFNLIALMIGDFVYDTQISFIGVVLGTLFSAVLAFGLEFFFFQLDYSRTERVQFEDDDYYYYVKAVPKVTLAEPERRVKKINRAHHAAQHAGRAAAHRAPRSAAADAGESGYDSYDGYEEEELRPRSRAYQQGARTDRETASSMKTDTRTSLVQTAASRIAGGSAGSARNVFRPAATGKRTAAGSASGQTKRNMAGITVRQPPGGTASGSAPAGRGASSRGETDDEVRDRVLRVGQDRPAGTTK